MHPVEQLIIDLIGSYKEHENKLKVVNFQKLREKFWQYVVAEATKRGMADTQAETAIALIEEEFLAHGITQMFHYLENKPLQIKLENMMAKQRGKFKGHHKSLGLPVEA